MHHWQILRVFGDGGKVQILNGRMAENGRQFFGLDKSLGKLESPVRPKIKKDDGVVIVYFGDRVILPA